MRLVVREPQAKLARIPIRARDGRVVRLGQARKKYFSKVQENEAAKMISGDHCGRFTRNPDKKVILKCPKKPSTVMLLKFA